MQLFKIVVFVEVVVVEDKCSVNQSARVFLLYVLAILTLLAATLTVLATLAILAVLEKSSPIARTRVVFISLYIVVVLFYPLGISRVFIIPRFAEILPREYARGSGGRFVVEHSLRATELVECVGRKAVCLSLIHI